MFAQTKNILKRIGVILFGAIVSLVIIGFLLFPRAELPEPVPIDYCAQYGIRFDASSMEKIYLDSQEILVDPEKFLQEDQAYLLFARHRERVHDPFPYEAWIKDIKQLASKSSSISFVDDSAR